MKNIQVLALTLLGLTIASTARAMEVDGTNEDAAAQTLSVFSQAPVHTALQETQAGPSNPPKASSYTGLTARMKAHSHTPQELQYPCPHCSDRFPINEYLRTHIRKKHPEKIFSCPHCGRQSECKENRDKHIVGCPCNPVNKQFCICPMCPQLQFNSAEAAQRHAELKHRGKKIFACQYCEKSYTEIGRLKKHIKEKHEAAFPYALPFHSHKRI